MVAICTGPAFATDDAGNLILAGERRKANPTPCALKDCNGLYTAPAGGAWAVDQVALCQQQSFVTSSSTVVPAGGSVPFEGAEFTITNPHCWAIHLNVQLTWGHFSWVNKNTEMYFEVGVSTSTPNVPWSIVFTNSFYPNDSAPLSYTDWITNNTQLVTQFRIEAHTSRKVYAGARLTSRFGSGGTLRSCTYHCDAWGYAVI